MQHQNLFFSNETFLGVCEAIGRDFGFHPNWLRLVIAGAFFFNPLVVAAVYVALGVPVAAARWFFPASPSQPGSVATVSADPAMEDEADPQQQLPLAA